MLSAFRFHAADLLSLPPIRRFRLADIYFFEPPSHYAAIAADYATDTPFAADIRHFADSAAISCHCIFR